MSCADCGGPFHEATGHAFTETFVLCGPCAGRFWAWVVSWTKKRVSRRKSPSATPFYVAAGTSVRA